MKRTWPRIVIHADMDAFYASVEQLDRPELRGRPVLIGPNSHRGVVLTASYEARPFGVGSAMPVAEARRRCPDAVMVSPRPGRYEEVSRQVMEVLGDFAPKVEPISLDEAFLDMTGAEHFFGPPHAMGDRIKTAVFKATGLNISVGVSGTKYVAKVASDFGKPDGLVVVPPVDASAWLAPQSVTRLWGVGKKTAAKLKSMGFVSIGDIAKADGRLLEQRLGRWGLRLHELANGIDPRSVRRGRGAKSMGSDRTLSRDVKDPREIETHLRRASERIARRVRQKGYVARGVRVRLKTTEFNTLTRQRLLPRATDIASDFYDIAKHLLPEFDHPGPYRLVGLAVYQLQWRDHIQQQEMFVQPSQRRLEQTIDDLAEKFGGDMVCRGSDLLSSGTISDNGMNLDFLDYRDGERVSRPE